MVVGGCVVVGMVVEGWVGGVVGAWVCVVMGGVERQARACPGFTVNS